MIVHTNFFYGKNYEKALRLKEDEEGHLKENFVKKYPYADLTRFRFVASVGPNLKNVGVKIEFVTNENYFIDIRASTFTNNKEYTKHQKIWKTLRKNFSKNIQTQTQDDLCSERLIIKL